MSIDERDVFQRTSYDTATASAAFVIGVEAVRVYVFGKTRIYEPGFNSGKRTALYVDCFTAGSNGFRYSIDARSRGNDFSMFYRLIVDIEKWEAYVGVRHYDAPCTTELPPAAKDVASEHFGCFAAIIAHSAYHKMFAPDIVNPLDNRPYCHRDSP